MRIAFFLILLNFFFCFSQKSAIDSVSILGLKKTKASFIKRIISTVLGEELDSLQLDLNITKLKRLPGISHASYSVLKSNKEPNIIVQYHIEENFTIIPSLAIWTAAKDQFSYKLGLYDFNLFGKGIAFGGSYQNNGEDSFSVNFRAPYLFTSKIGLAVNYQNWKSEEPLYFSNGTANYLYNNISLEVLGLFEPNLSNKIHLGGAIFNEQYQHVFGDVSPEIPRKLDIDKWMLKLVYDYDKLQYSYQYISGFRSLFISQFVSSTSSHQDDFLIAWNDFYYYSRITEKGNWANRLRVGLSSNSESPFAPFALDNNVNIRGVGNVIDRGTGSIVLNSEYRYTLLDKKGLAIQGNAFVDAGTWRKPGGTLKDFTQTENIRVYPGLGLRFMHKKVFNAIFRIDYGYGITEDASKGLVFGIGQYF